MRQLGQHSAPVALPTSTRKSWSFAVEQFGQRQIEAGLAFGPVFIDTQKQVPPGLAAIHGDDEMSCRRSR